MFKQVYYIQAESETRKLCGQSYGLCFRFVCGDGLSRIAKAARCKRKIKEEGQVQAE